MVLCFISMDVDIGLFSNANPPEDLAEDGVRGDALADGGEDGVQRSDGLAKVLSEEVFAYLQVQTAV